jgi:hypothetical protein
MGKIVVTEYISADGVVEALSGVESFERLGWTGAFMRGLEGDGCQAGDDSCRKEE